MKTCILDLETYWASDHTLSKMNSVAYCMHRKTEIQSLAYAFDKGPVEVLFGEADIQEFIRLTDWSNTLVVGHNMSQFDSMLLAWRLGLRPYAWGCTLAMARPVYASAFDKLSLANLCKQLNLGEKGDLEAIGTKGRKLASFTASERQQMAAYNKQDVELCRALFNHLLRLTPPRELMVIDLTIRMLIAPRLRVDTDLLQGALAQEKYRKKVAIEDLRTQLGLEPWVDLKAQLMSNPRLATLLENLGVEPPTKISPTTGKETYAFAKDDEGLKALLEHSNPLVSSAVETRLGVKSSMLETRIETFLTMAKATGGRMPIALNYWGASTGRWSGGMSANQQNLPRINPKEPKLSDALRKSLIAPPGHKIVVADLSGIELRVNHYLWQVKSSMDLYASDPEADLYKDFAAKFYNRPVEDVTKQERQFAKMMQLALGFGMGWKKFKVQAKLQGFLLSDYAAEQAVGKWREVYADIVNGWRACHQALAYIDSGEELPIDPQGLCVTEKLRVRLPTAKLRYPHLHTEPSAYQDGREEWWYGIGRGRSRINGPKLCIAEGTRVLTERGWVPIEGVTTADKVHDGVEFVQHGGLVYNGVQYCVRVDSVAMTPDHEVLTDDGWKTAATNPRPYRPDLRHVDCGTPSSQQRKEMVLGVPVSMWSRSGEMRCPRYERRKRRARSKLRVHDQTVHRGEEHTTRHDQASRLRGLAIYARSVSASFTSRLEELWWAGHMRMRSVARSVRELLAGYGAGVHTGLRYRPDRQQRPVLAGELPLGYSPEEYDEQEDFRARSRYPQARREARHSAEHSILSGKTRPAAVGSSNEKEAFSVFDIADAGPRHRFVVLGHEGPFIVHNCENLVQSLARHVLVGHMLTISSRYPITHTVHDEVILVVPEEEAQAALDFMLETMKTPPKWWPELVLWAEGDIGDSYGDAK